MNEICTKCMKFLDESRKWILSNCYLPIDPTQIPYELVRSLNWKCGCSTTDLNGILIIYQSLMICLNIHTHRSNTQFHMNWFGSFNITNNHKYYKSCLTIEFYEFKKCTFSGKWPMCVPHFMNFKSFMTFMKLTNVWFSWFSNLCDFIDI